MNAGSINQGPNSQTISGQPLRQFSDLRQSYVNWRIHRTFTTIFRPILRQNLYDHLLVVLRQLGPNSQIGLLS